MWGPMERNLPVLIVAVLEGSELYFRETTSTFTFKLLLLITGWQQTCSQDDLKVLFLSFEHIASIALSSFVKLCHHISRCLRTNCLRVPYSLCTCDSWSVIILLLSVWNKLYSNHRAKCHVNALHLKIVSTCSYRQNLYNTYPLESRTCSSHVHMP